MWIRHHVVTAQYVNGEVAQLKIVRQIHGARSSRKSWLFCLPSRFFRLAVRAVWGRSTRPDAVRHYPLVVTHSDARPGVGFAISNTSGHGTPMASCTTGDIPPY